MIIVFIPFLFMLFCMALIVEGIELFWPIQAQKLLEVMDIAFDRLHDDVEGWIDWLNDSDDEYDDEME